MGEIKMKNTRDMKFVVPVHLYTDKKGNTADTVTLNSEVTLTVQAVVDGYFQMKKQYERLKELFAIQVGPFLILTILNNDVDVDGDKLYKHIKEKVVNKFCEENDLTFVDMTFKIEYTRKIEK